MRSLVALVISWGPLGVLFLAALDSAGVPIPAGVDALLVAVAAVNPAAAYFSAALAVIGSTAGNLLLFWLARKGGEMFLNRHAASLRAVRLREWFQRYGLLTVFVPALIPIPMPMKVFVISAGALGVTVMRFLAVVLVARIPRYLGLAYLGTRLGEDSMDWLRQHVWHLTGMALALFIALYVVLRLADKRRPSPLLQ